MTPEQYIIDITYKIWEDHGVGRIHDWYAAECPRRSPHGVTHTIADVVRETLESIALFPDGELLADDVIIGDKASGFYSSHRVRHPSTHLGAGSYGPATGRRITTFAIADCLCRDNRIVEEWELGDGAIAMRQLGIDPVEFGRALGRRHPEAYGIGNKAMRERWANPGGVGLITVGDRAIADRIVDTCDAIWNRRRLDMIAERYDRAVRFEGPGGYLGYGRTNMTRELQNILASVPDGTFEAHHLIVRQQPNRPDRVALRWTYCGMHEGQGHYGPPTGAPIAFLGISHMELRDGLISSEWMLADDTAVYAQIAAHEGASTV